MVHYNLKSKAFKFWLHLSYDMTIVYNFMIWGCAFFFGMESVSIENLFL